MPNESWRTLYLGTPESQGQKPPPKALWSPVPQPQVFPLLSGQDSSSRPYPARRFLREEDQVVATALAPGRKEGGPFGGLISGLPGRANPA